MNSSQLALLARTEVMIVTCESNPAEMEALRARGARSADVDPARGAILAHSKVSQAVAVRLTEESGGELRLFTMGPRLTLHVRHREKYVDVPVSSHRAFVFAANGQPARRVRTLRQFVSALESTPPPLLAGYILRGDFSRWIGEMFGDRALADQLRAVEQRYRTGLRADTLPAMATAARGRDDLAEGELETIQTVSV